MTSTEFRQFRSQLGLSQSELGRIMGLTAREISRIEISRNPTRMQAAFIRYIAAERVAAELKDLRAENVKLKGTVSIKQDRVNDLEKALRDTLRQLERAINGNAMNDDWISAELHGRECLYSQA